jgi:hypothetical protein
MFKTKNLVHDVKDVPITWIFETYCKLKEKLIGQDVKIKSLFNSKERTPSMCIYVADDKRKIYKYKDFSSGKGGSAIDLVKDVEQLSYYKTCQQIVEKYNDFILHNNGGYDLKEFKQASKYKVKSYMFRSWNTSDQYYWTQFNIGSRLLNEYCVRPLEYYTLEKEVEGELNSLTIHGNYLYGYFKKDETLYKIYQPKTLDKKFIKVNDYIQGTEQLNNSKYLVITSSLKDVMSLRSLKMDMDVIAPDSENTFIRKEQMLEYIKNYKKVIVLFDYDEAGIQAMAKYKITYPEVAVAVLPMSKDISDSIKDHGAKKVLLTLVPLLDKKLQDL